MIRGRLLFRVILFIFIAVVSTSSMTLPAFIQDSGSNDKFVYADFEHIENGRAVSNNGGLVQIYVGQESTAPTFKGLANASPGAPEIVRQQGNDSNHVAFFEYSL